MNQMRPIFKWAISTLAALALLTTGFYFKGQAQPTKPTVSRDSATEVHSLLIQMTDSSSNLGGLVLLTNDVDTGLTVFNIPKNSVASFGEAGLLTVGDAGNRLPANLVSDGISAATGIRIDATLSMSKLAVAGLVDSVGGVVVDPTKGLLISGDNEEPMYVAPGHHKLDGRYASGYMMAKQIFETDKDQFDRINDVFTQVLSRLPSNVNKLDETLSALGSLARSDVSTRDISKFLISLNVGHEWKDSKYLAVKTDASELELMKDSNWLRIRQPDTFNLAAVHAPNELGVFTKSKLRIEVKSELPDDRAAAAADFAQLGVHFIDGGYADTPTTTKIVASSDTSVADIENLRNRMGLPDVPFTWDFAYGDYADIQIILGLDYREKQLALGTVK